MLKTNPNIMPNQSMNHLSILRRNLKMLIKED